MQPFCFYICLIFWS